MTTLSGSASGTSQRVAASVLLALANLAADGTAAAHRVLGRVV
jgi:hypothetical protein